MLHRSAATQSVLQAGRPPIVTELVHTSMTEGYVYDTNTRTVLARAANATVPPASTLAPSWSDTLLRGSSASDAAQGEWRVVDGGDDAALFYGALAVLPGNGAVDGAVVSTRVWDSTAWDETGSAGRSTRWRSTPTGWRSCSTAACRPSRAPTSGSRSSTRRGPSRRRS